MLAWLVKEVKARPKDSWVVGVSFKKKAREVGATLQAELSGGPRDGGVLRPKVVHART